MGSKRNQKRRALPRAIVLLVILLTGFSAAYLSLNSTGLRGFIQEYIFSREDQIVEDSPKQEEKDEEKPEELIEQKEDVTDPFEEEVVGEETEKEEEDKEASRDEVAKDDETSNLDSEANEYNDDLKVIADGDYLLALVTKNITLKYDYVPSDLKPIPSYMNPAYDMQLREEALEHLKDVYEAAEADGVTLGIRSAYRSYETQRRIFNDYAESYGEEEANRFSARPGQSEHQLGTTVDFGGTEIDFTDEFAYTEQGEWLAENAQLYGFALSYPENKEKVTGYIYEPWHYRYIGVDAAKEWKESGLTLKEYLKQQPQEVDE
ncbi:MAG: M15 family metallopeptidase [Bacillota bacterium]